MSTTTHTSIPKRPAAGRGVRSKALLGSALALCSLALQGCNNAGQGAFTGASAGALVGLGLGSLSGDAGKGAAAGALIGGLGGAVIGDQNERNARYAHPHNTHYDRYHGGYHRDDRHVHRHDHRYGTWDHRRYE